MTIDRLRDLDDNPEFDQPLSCAERGGWGVVAG